jgi:hypothetical protein
MIFKIVLPHYQLLTSLWAQHVSSLFMTSSLYNSVCPRLDCATDVISVRLHKM